MPKKGEIITYSIKLSALPFQTELVSHWALLLLCAEDKGLQGGYQLAQRNGNITLEEISVDQMVSNKNFKDTAKKIQAYPVVDAHTCKMNFGMIVHEFNKTPM